MKNNDALVERAVIRDIFFLQLFLANLNPPEDNRDAEQEQKKDGEDEKEKEKKEKKDDFEGRWLEDFESDYSLPDSQLAESQVDVSDVIFVDF